MDHVHSLLVDRHNKVLWEAWVGHLVHFEESGAIRRPSVDHLEEGDLGFVGAHAGVLVVRPRDLLLPLVAGLHLDTGVNILRLWIEKWGI